MTPPRFVNETETATREAFTGQIGRALGPYKKGAGLKSIRQNYKGTGSQRARRQLYIQLTTGQVIDVWLDTDSYILGGVTVTRVPGRWPYGDRTPEAIAGAIAGQLQALQVLAAVHPGDK